MKRSHTMLWTCHETPDDAATTYTNVVSYNQSIRQGNSAATFYVWRQVYLPLLLR